MATTLFYFDLPGRAEATRIALTVAGVKFEDKRFSFPEFGASSFNALPVLQVPLRKSARPDLLSLSCFSALEGPLDSLKCLSRLLCK